MIVKLEEKKRSLKPYLFDPEYMDDGGGWKASEARMHTCMDNFKQQTDTIIQQRPFNFWEVHYLSAGVVWITLKLPEYVFWTIENGLQLLLFFSSNFKIVQHSCFGLLYCVKGAWHIIFAGSS